jgi:hypothetical protein
MSVSTEYKDKINQVISDVRALDLEGTKIKGPDGKPTTRMKFINDWCLTVYKSMLVVWFTSDETTDVTREKFIELFSQAAMTDDWSPFGGSKAEEPTKTDEPKAEPEKPKAVNGTKPEPEPEPEPVVVSTPVAKPEPTQDTDDETIPVTITVQIPIAKIVEAVAARIAVPSITTDQVEDIAKKQAKIVLKGVFSGLNDE